MLQQKASNSNWHRNKNHYHMNYKCSLRFKIYLHIIWWLTSSVSPIISCKRELRSLNRILPGIHWGAGTNSRGFCSAVSIIVRADAKMLKFSGMGKCLGFIALKTYAFWRRVGKASTSSRLNKAKKGWPERDYMFFEVENSAKVTKKPDQQFCSTT